MNHTKKLYVMISKTDTGVGKLIRQVTKFPYNHVSLTLDESFRTWVSFARYIQDTPLYGGFIVEPVERYLAKGQRIDVRIFAVDIPEDRYTRLKELFSLAGKQDPRLLYNLFELVTASVGIDVPISGAYTCLGFANTILDTRHKTIQAFNAHWEPCLYYEGSLADLAPDSGRRDDIYFTRLGFRQGAVYSLKAIVNLLRFALRHERSDPVTVALNEQALPR